MKWFIYLQQTEKYNLSYLQVFHSNLEAKSFFLSELEKEVDCVWLKELFESLYVQNVAQSQETVLSQNHSQPLEKPKNYVIPSECFIFPSKELTYKKNWKLWVFKRLTPKITATELIIRSSSA